MGRTPPPQPVHGCKAHVATDEGAGLVRGIEVTTANVHDAAELERVPPPEPGEIYGDSAFTGDRAWSAIRARGGLPAAQRDGPIQDESAYITLNRPPRGGSKAQHPLLQSGTSETPIHELSQLVRAQLS